MGAGIVLAAAMLVLARVPRGHAGIVERTGRYARTLGAGRAVLLPVLERVGALVDLGEQELAVTADRLATADDRRVSVVAAVRYTVGDPVRATYEVPDLAHAIEAVCVTALRDFVGRLAIEDAVGGRWSMASALREVLESAAGQWGIRIDGVEVARVDRENRGAGARAAEA